MNHPLYFEGTQLVQMLIHPHRSGLDTESLRNQTLHSCRPSSLQPVAVPVRLTRPNQRLLSAQFGLRLMVRMKSLPFLVTRSARWSRFRNVPQDVVKVTTLALIPTWMIINASRFSTPAGRSAIPRKNRWRAQSRTFRKFKQHLRKRRPC